MQRRLLSLLQSAQVLSTAFASQRSDRHVTSTVLSARAERTRLCVPRRSSCAFAWLNRAGCCTLLASDGSV